MSFANKNKFRDAIADFKRALELNPKHAMAQECLSKTRDALAAHQKQKKAQEKEEQKQMLPLPSSGAKVVRTEISSKEASNAQAKLKALMKKS